MRIRRILAAVFATAALAGLGLTGAATATAATPSPTPGQHWITSEQCKEGGGTQEGFTCKGGTYDGRGID
ncbi:hypothetical protein ACIHCX_23445 [Streptomyces sp. NPDC052043]|uniref:hypothetical protein n=1 Tax=Streptomyces sp. NPDC052043 TaxID=3365684 RepID=UPI0037CD6909